MPIVNMDQTQQANLAAINDWITFPKWKPEELNGKSVEFEAVVEGSPKHGFGKLEVTCRPDGRVRIRIRDCSMDSQPGEVNPTELYVPQSCADFILKTPDGLADFKIRDPKYAEVRVALGLSH